VATLLAFVATILTSFLPILNKRILRDARPALVAWVINAASLPILAAGTLRLTQCSFAFQYGAITIDLCCAYPTRRWHLCCGFACFCPAKLGGDLSLPAFIVPPAPAIFSLHDLAQVSRSTYTTITYRVQGGKLLGIVALGLGAKAIAHLDTSGYATVNTSAFPGGVGSISLTQTLEFQAPQTGTPFKSLFADGTGMTMVTITWI